MSGGGSTAPQGYQPTGQPAADQNYQNLVAGAMPYASSLPSTVIPGLQNVASNVASNPYYAQAQAGAGTAATQGATTAGYQAAGAQNLYAGGSDAAATGSTLANSALGTGANSAALGSLAQNSSQNDILRGQKLFTEGQSALAQNNALIPSTTQGANYAGGQLSMADLMAMLTSGQALSAIPGLTGGMDAATQVLNTGFDPQNALYNRTLQQTTDQQNAINSMSGLGTSPYGAGLAAQNNQNFNIDWQNNQLSRETQALGAYGTEQGVDTNDLTSLLNSAAGNYANLTNAGVNQYTGLTSNAANNMATLTNSGMGAANTGFQDYNSGMQTWLQGVQAQLAGNQQNLGAMSQAGNSVNAGLAAQGAAYGQGSQLGIDSLQTGLAASQAPSQTFLGQQQAQVDALGALAQGGTQSLAPTQGLIGDENSYLQTGNQATQTAIQATNANNATTQAMWGALGSAAGTAAMFLI